jgi:hypothetical protein
VTLFALAAAALVLGVACAWVKLGRGRQALWALATFALLGGLGGASIRAVGSLVAHDLTVLHEGGTARTLAALFGRDQHAGALWREAIATLARGSGELPVFSLARLNLALGALSAAGVAVLAAVAAKHPAGGLVALLVVASSRTFWNGLHGETPAPAVWFAFVTAAPAWKLLDDARERPPTHHLLALASLLASTTLAAGVREEFAALGAPVTLLALGTFLQGAAAPDALWTRARGALTRLLHAPFAVRAGLAGTLLATAYGASQLDFHARLGVAALAPTLSLHAPAALVTVVPTPVVALALVGVASLARRGVAGVAYVAPLASLFAVYLVGSHGVGWEMLRYATLAAAAVWLAALAGWVALERFATERSWHPAWRSSLALLALFFLPVPWGVDPLGPGWWDAASRVESVPLRRLVDRSAQREARLIVRSLSEAPACLHVARVRARGEPDDPLVLVTFARGQAPEVVRDRAATVQSLRAEAGACLRYVRSLDCNLRRAAGRCDDDLRGAEAALVVHERFAPYDDPTEYGEHTPEVSYGVWRVAR